MFFKKITLSLIVSFLLNLSLPLLSMHQIKDEKKKESNSNPIREEFIKIDEELDEDEELGEISYSSPEEKKKCEGEHEETLNAYRSFPFNKIHVNYNDNSPTKSKLMLSDPKMSDEFRDFIYSNICPKSIIDIIDARQRYGKRSFTCNAGNYLTRKILLHGPNGTGKSTLAVLIAKMFKTKLLFVNSGFLGSMYRKSEEINLSEEIAPLLKDSGPCVVVIDEADAIVAMGNDNEKMNRNRAAAIGQMMDMVKEHPNIILVWTTNHIDEIGEKFKDRISRRIKIDLPNKEKRRKILEYLIQKIEYDSDEVSKTTLEKGFTLEEKKSHINNLFANVKYCMTFGCCRAKPKLNQKDRKREEIKINGSESKEYAYFRKLLTWTVDFDSIVNITNGFSIRKIEDSLKFAFEVASLRLPKLNEEEMELDVLPTRHVILKMQDVYDASKKIKKELFSDWCIKIKKDASKMVKDHALIGIGSAAIIGIAGSIIVPIYLHHQAKKHANQLANDSKWVNYKTAFIGGGAIIIAALINKIGKKQ